MIPRVLFLLTVVAATGTATAADWPQWRGPNRDGKSADTNLLKAWPDAGPRLVWSVSAPDAIGAGYGSPAVVGDRLFILGSDSAKKDGQEYCAALSVADGKPIWRVGLKTSPGDFNDGWGGGTRSTPTVDGDTLYALGSTGDLVALKLADGKEVWRKNLVKDFGGGIPVWGYSESVLVDGNNVICTPGGKGGMVALDKATGKTVWQCKEFTDGAGYSSVIPTVVGGVRQYVQQTMGSGVGVRAKDGKMLWKVGEIGRKVAVIPTPIVKDGGVFFTAGYGAGCEYYTLAAAGDGTKATKVYTKNNNVVNHHGGVIELGGNVFGFSDGKGWVCFDFTKGPDDTVWANKGPGKGSITFADGHFYCYGEAKGELVRIKATADAWEPAGKLTIPKTSKLRPGNGKVWAHPVISNGKLYLRDYEMLYVYDLKLPGA
ncbi:MAG: PQQ-binding-like beta-propeller repeat protein [Fimbriiglobus sp.]